MFKKRAISAAAVTAIALGGLSVPAAQDAFAASTVDPQFAPTSRNEGKGFADAVSELKNAEDAYRDAQESYLRSQGEKDKAGNTTLAPLPQEIQEQRAAKAEEARTRVLAAQREILAQYNHVLWDQRGPVNSARSKAAGLNGPLSDVKGELNRANKSSSTGDRKDHNDKAEAQLAQAFKTFEDFVSANPNATQLDSLRHLNTVNVGTEELDAEARDAYNASRADVVENEGWFTEPSDTNDYINSNEAGRDDIFAPVESEGANWADGIQGDKDTNDYVDGVNDPLTRDDVWAPVESEGETWADGLQGDKDTNDYVNLPEATADDFEWPAIPDDHQDSHKASSVNGKCVASAVGFGLPLLALIPLGLAAQAAIPGLAPVRDEVSNQIREANSQLQQQLGVFQPALAAQAEAANDQLRDFGTSAAQVGGAAALIAAGLIGGSAVLHNCVAGAPAGARISLSHEGSSK